MALVLGAFYYKGGRSHLVPPTCAGGHLAVGGGSPPARPSAVVPKGWSIEPLCRTNTPWSQLEQAPPPLLHTPVCPYCWRAGHASVLRVSRWGNARVRQHRQSSESSQKVRWWWGQAGKRRKQREAGARVSHVPSQGDGRAVQMHTGTTLTWLESQRNTGVGRQGLTKREGEEGESCPKHAPTRGGAGRLDRKSVV